MLTIETIVAFLTASVLLGLAPGPDNIFVIAQSAMHGRRAGLAVVFGLCTGLIGHSAAVALGVAVIFQKSAVAFSVLKFIGAGYLIYLAWQAFRAKGTVGSNGSTPELSLRKLYVRGIVMNLTNPKVSIFFLAFLPQFADPSRGPVWLQIVQLGGLFMVSTVVVFGSIALLSGTLGQVLQRDVRVQRTLNKVAGTVFLGLALKLVMSRR